MIDFFSLQDLSEGNHPNKLATISAYDLTQNIFITLGPVKNFYRKRAKFRSDSECS